MTTNKLVREGKNALPATLKDTFVACQEVFYPDIFYNSAASALLTAIGSCSCE